MLEALSVPRRSYSPLLLGLSHLPGIPREEAMAALGQYCDALTVRLRHVQERWESQRPLPYFVEAMFQHSRVMLEAELAWVKGFMEQEEESDVQD